MKSCTARLAALAAGALAFASMLAPTSAAASTHMAGAHMAGAHRADAHRAGAHRASTHKAAEPLQAAEPPHKAAEPPHTLLQSRELWATVDVCSPSDQPDTVGVRGSMPGDGHPKDTMYMSFQLQYLEAKTSTWVDLHDGNSTFIEIGSAKAARQGGWSVQLKPPAGHPAYTIRGIVMFQWRQDEHVVHEATRTTQAGHKSLADADPSDYSAAECSIP